MASVTYRAKTPQGWKEDRDLRKAAAMAREAHKRDSSYPAAPRAQVVWRGPNGEKCKVTVDAAHADEFLKRAAVAEERGEAWDGLLVSGPPPSPTLADALVTYIEGEKDRGLGPVTLRRIDSMMNVLIRAVAANDPRDREGNPAVDAEGNPTVRALHDRSVPLILRSLDDHAATAGNRRTTFLRWWKWMSAMEPYSEHTRANEFAVPARRTVAAEARPAPTWAQADAAIAALRDAGEDRIADRLTIARYTGLRIDEVQTLEWADVDLTAGTITIRAEKTKTRRGRTVPMCAPLRSFLRTINGGEPGRVVGGMRDTKVNRKVIAAWRTTDADPGAYEPRTNGGIDADGNARMGHARVNHTLRAVVMQGLRDAGVPDAVRKHIVGHRATDTEGQHYSAPPWPQQVAAVAKIPPVDPRAARRGEAAAATVTATVPRATVKTL